MKRVLPLLQSTIWSAVKSIIPGFIQGMNSKAIIENIKGHIDDTFLSISLDGSGFDGTQYSDLLKKVDNKFFPIMQDHFARVI